MTKIKFLFIGLMAFVLSGCYTSLETTETQAQVHVGVYINYDFHCGYCNYEMYWCPFCQTYHVHINHWCHNHYYWYTNWYVVYYYYPSSYYYNHWHNHYAHRDYHRHYVHDSYGLRVYGSNKVLTSKRDYTGRDFIEKNYKSVDLQNDIKYKSPNLQKDVKYRPQDVQKTGDYKSPNLQKDVQYKSPNVKNNTKYNTTPPVNKNNSIQKSPNTNRNNTIQKSPQRTNTQKSSGNKNSSTMKRK